MPRSKPMSLSMRLGTLTWPLRQRILNLGFRACQRAGFHITRNHFYGPIPDTRTLKDELWLRQSELVGINLNEQGQLELLDQFASRFKQEYDEFPKDYPSSPHEYYLDNEVFGPVDGEILYCMIRHFQPKRVVEVGSGYSTLLSAQAILKNEEDSGNRAELTAIDPYPNETIRRGFAGLSKLIIAKVENVDMAEFLKLQENDILFIDTSHVLKIGNDVQYEYLEILPSLNKGVIVHIHDIFLPMGYPKKWVQEWRLFWNEQYLLQAFLAFNSDFEVLWAASYMHLRHPEELEEAFGSYRRLPGPPVWSQGTVWPGSFWIRRKA